MNRVISPYALRRVSALSARDNYQQANTQEIPAIHKRLSALEVRLFADFKIKRFNLLAKVAALRGFTAIRVMEIPSRDYDILNSMLEEEKYSPKFLLGTSRLVWDALADSEFSLAITSLSGDEKLPYVLHAYW